MMMRALMSRRCRWRGGLSAGSPIDAAATSSPPSSSAARGFASSSAASDDDDGPPVVVEERGAYAVVTMNRPRSLNALSRELSGALLDALRRLDASPHVRAVVVAGSGKAFAAGVDIKELSPLASPDEARASTPFGAVDGVEGIRTPLVAAVQGYALGGGFELAMACDVIVAGEGAVFGLPELKLGLIPALGGTQRLPRLVGRPLASDMLLTGRRLSAREALSAGLVSRVAADPLAEAAAVAAAVAAGSSAPAAAAAKAAVRAADALPLHLGMARERELFCGLFGGPDQKEGVAAFVEKRPPRFGEPKPGTS